MEALTEQVRERVTLGLTLGIFVSALEMTVVATAMPTVIAELGGLSHYSWVFSAFLLASTVTLPVWGKLADLYGRKRFYLLGLGLFLLGSALSGQAHTMGQLIAFRTVQGLGAGALIPLGLAIAGEILSFEERARKQALFSSAWGIASILGPIVGGYITEHFSWRWVFYLGIPFGLAAALLVGRALPSQQRSAVAAQVHIGSTVMLMGASLSLLFLVEGGGLNLRKGMLLGAFIAMLVLFLRMERGDPEPFLPMDFLSERTISLSLLVSWLTGMAFLGSIGFFPLFVQGALGESPAVAGKSLLPLFLSWVVSSIIASRLTLRVGFRSIILLAAVALIAGFAMLTPLGGAPSLLKAFAALILIGVGMGLSNVTILLLVQYSVPAERLGRATASVIFLRSLGGALGASLLGAVTNWRLRAQGEMSAVDVRSLELMLSSRAASVATLSSEGMVELRLLLGRALREAFVVGVLVAVLTLLVALFLPRAEARDEERSESSLYPIA
jgi:EmrB/QacA subfamily drug resistance transporter